MACNAQDNTPIANAARGRSSSGCWTCRVRRKKCDERSGRCAACVSLRLKCDGYGPKPAWMDGGLREKHKVEDLQARVRRHRKRRQASVGQGQATQGQGHRPDTSPRHRSSISGTSLSGTSLSGTSLSGTSLSGLTLGSNGVAVDPGGASVQGDENVPWDPTPAARTADNSSKASETHLDDTLGAIVDFDNPQSAGQSSGPEPLVFPEHAKQSIDVHWAAGASSGLYDWGWGEFADSSQAVYQSSKSELSKRMEAIETEHQLLSASTNAEIDSGLEHFEYLPLQNNQSEALEAFTLLPPRWDDLDVFNGQGLGQESLDTEFKLTCLSENTRHLIMTAAGETIEALPGPGSAVYFFAKVVLPNRFPHAEEPLALRLREVVFRPQIHARDFIHSTIETMVRHVKSHGLKRYGLETSPRHSRLPRDEGLNLDLVTQALSCDPVCEDDVVQTKCMEEVLITLIQRVLFQVDDLPPGADILGAISKLAVGNCMPPKSESSLLSLCYALLAAVDLIGAATFSGTLKTWPSSHSSALQSSSLVQMLGCQSWVFQRILDITNLRTWKEAVTATGTLSVVELARKSSEIQLELENHQAALREEATTPHNHDILQITEVYALAAEVYLHTTTSGAHPDVSNIRDAVSATVAAIQHLEAPQLLQSLSWPICVVASMAGPEYGAFFSSIEAGARSDGDCGIKLTRALTVARECQRLRNMTTSVARSQESRAYDWFDAMESLSQEWYLL